MLRLLVMINLNVMFFNHDMNKLWNIINSFKVVLFYFFLTCYLKKSINLIDYINKLLLLCKLEILLNLIIKTNV
jgi:hypothetical protein